MLTDCTIAGNSASGGDGGGIYNNGPLTITSSTISGNSVSGGGDGGGIANEDNMSMTDCTLSGNSVSGGSGGGIDNEASLTMTQCTVIGNSASGLTAGGGIYNTNAPWSPRARSRATRPLSWPAASTVMGRS